jgi:hypothetical protein
MTGTTYQEGLFEPADAVRVLAVRQPHAYLLIHGSPSHGRKEVENRSKPTSHRGGLLIQATAQVDRAAYAEYVARGVELPPIGELVTGAIIGRVTVTGCVRDADDWSAIPGDWHWLTDDAVAARQPIPFSGQLSLAKPPAGWQTAF